MFYTDCQIFKTISRQNEQCVYNEYNLSEEEFRHSFLVCHSALFLVLFLLETIDIINTNVNRKKFLLIYTCSTCLTKQIS